MIKITARPAEWIHPFGREILEYWNNAGLLIFFSSILPLFSAQFKATLLEGAFSNWYDNFKII